MVSRSPTIKPSMLLRMAGTVGLWHLLMFQSHVILSFAFVIPRNGMNLWHNPKATSLNVKDKKDEKKVNPFWDPIKNNSNNFNSKNGFNGSGASEALENLKKEVIAKDIELTLNDKEMSNPNASFEEQKNNLSNLSNSIKPEELSKSADGLEKQKYDLTDNEQAVADLAILAARYMVTVEKLQQKQKYVRIKIQQFESMAKAIRESSSAATLDQVQAKDKFEKAMKRVTDLETELKEASVSEQQLKETLRKNDKALEEAKLKVSQLQFEQEQSQYQQDRESSIKAKRLEVQLKEMIGRERNLTSKLILTRTELEEAKYQSQAVQDQEQELTVAQDKVMKLQQELVNATKSQLRLTATWKETQQALENATQQVAMLETALKESNKEKKDVKELEETLRKNDKALEEAKLKVSQLQFEQEQSKYQQDRESSIKAKRLEVQLKEMIGRERNLTSKLILTRTELEEAKYNQSLAASTNDGGKNVTVMEMELVTAMARIAKLKDDLTKAQTSEKKLEGQLEETKAKLAEKQNATANDTAALVNATSVASKAEIKATEKKLAKALEKVSDLERQLQNMTSIKTDLEHELSKTSQELKEASKIMDDLSVKAIELEESLTKISSLEKELETLSKSEQDLQSSLKATKQQWEEATGKIELLEKEVRDSKEAAKAANITASAASVSVTKATADDKAKSDEKFKQQEEKLAHALANITNLEKDLQSMTESKDKLQKSYKDIELSLFETKAKSATLQTKEDELLKAQSELKQLERKYNITNMSEKMLKSTLEDTKVALEKSTDTVKLLRLRETKLSDEIKAMSAKVEEATKLSLKSKQEKWAKGDELQKSLEETKQSLDVANFKIRALTTEKADNEKTEDELSKAYSKISTLGTELEVTSRKQETLKQTLELTNSELTNSRNQVMALQAAERNLKQKLMQAELRAREVESDQNMKTLELLKEEREKLQQQQQKFSFFKSKPSQDAQKIKDLEKAFESLKKRNEELASQNLRLSSTVQTSREQELIAKIQELEGALESSLATNARGQQSLVGALEKITALQQKADERRKEAEKAAARAQFLETSIKGAPMGDEFPAYEETYTEQDLFISQQQYGPEFGELQQYDPQYQQSRRQPKRVPPPPEPFRPSPPASDLFQQQLPPKQPPRSQLQPAPQSKTGPSPEPFRPSPSASEQYQQQAQEPKREPPRNPFQAPAPPREAMQSQQPKREPPRQPFRPPRPQQRPVNLESSSSELTGQDLVRLRASSARKQNVDNRDSVKQKPPGGRIRWKGEEEETQQKKKESKDGPLARLRFSTPADRIKYKKPERKPREKSNQGEALAKLQPLSAREQYGVGALGAPPGGAGFSSPSQRGPPPPQIANSFGAAAMAELEKKRAAGTFDEGNNYSSSTSTTANTNDSQNWGSPAGNEVDQFESELNDAMGLVSNLEQELFSAMKDQQETGEDS